MDLGKGRWVALDGVTAAIGLTGWPGRALATASPPHPVVDTRFVSLTGATWPELAAGAAGQAVIEYYLPSRGPHHASLVVWLRDDGRASLARVYEAASGRTWVPINWSRALAPQLSRLKPIMVVAAPAGWWSRGGLPDYNVTVDVFGPVYTMWGGKPGPASYLSAIRPGPLAFVVYLHGSAPGIPAWDDRRLIPPLGGGNYIRASYAQPECATPRTWVPGPSPLWPYVAYGGHFLQGIGTETPPIVMNWATGTVAKFSEVVSLRNQSCSYGFYSTAPVVPGHLNHPAFESPWGFYTLDPKATGLPNLVIRVNWQPTHTLGQLGLHRPTPLALSALARSSETVRYSWADHPGNQEFNYKVDMLGFQTIKAHTRIMGGQETIVAPGYAGYPARLMGERWPVTTFIDQNAHPYLTSEGLYAWPAGRVGHAFLFGEQGTPDLAAYDTLAPGTRGEYRIGPAARPWLYASPVDGKLHLLGAQAGLWQVTASSQVVERNLGPGPYINDWRLFTKGSGGYRPVSRLDALDGSVWLYAGPHGLVVRLAPFTASAFQVLPPTTPVSWQRFVQQVAPYQQGKSPRHLSQWLPARSAASLTATAGQVTAVVSTPTGFQAVITVGPGGARSQLPGVAPHVAAGRYALSYTRATERFRLVPAPPGSIHLAIRGTLAPAHPGQPDPLALTVRNAGPGPWRGTVRVLAGRHHTVFAAAIPAGGTWRGATTVAVGPARRLVVRVAVHHQSAVLRSAVTRTRRPSVGRLAALSFDSPTATAAFLAGLLLLAGLSGTVWRRHAHPTVLFGGRKAGRPPGRPGSSRQGNRDRVKEAPHER